MITGEYCRIRTTEADDAPALYRVYDTKRPRAALFDLKKEIQLPTVAELRALLATKDKLRGIFYTVEDLCGEIIGFCGLRAMNHEAQFCELVMLFRDDATLGGPACEEVLGFLMDRAFGLLALNKVTVRCLDRESELRAFLTAHDFVSDGVERDVFYGQGRWHDLESLTRFAPKRAATRHPQEAAPCHS